MPVLVAAYPAMFVAAGNAGESPMVDVALSVVLLAALGALLHAGVARTAPPRIHFTVVGVIASVLNAVLFCGVLLAERLPHVRLRYGLAALVASALVLVWYLWKVGGERRGAWRAVAMVTLAAYGAVGYEAFTAHRLRRDLDGRLQSMSSLRAPLSATVASGRSAPDIYLLILDNYASTEVLASRFGFANTEFLDSLRSLGFVTPVTRSNYAHTAHSLASMLNLGYLDPLAGFPSAARLWPLYSLIYDDRTTRLLGDLGYATYVVPSLGWGGTRRHDRSRVHLVSREVGPVLGTLARAELLGVVWRRTLMGHLAPGLLPAPNRARTALLAFEGTRDLIDDPGPKFVLAHSLATHAPFLHDARCGPRAAGLLAQESGDEADARAYVDEIRCTNRQVLSLVDDIRRRSRRPAVILLQADHGPRSLGAPLDGPPSRITPAQAAERFGAFGAYHFPDRADVVGDTVTPVNLVRAVLSHYLGTGTPPLPARFLYNTAERPFEFHEVEPSDLAPRLDRSADDGGARALD